MSLGVHLTSRNVGITMGFRFLSHVFHAPSSVTVHRAHVFLSGCLANAFHNSQTVIHFVQMSESVHALLWYEILDQLNGSFTNHLLYCWVNRDAYLVVFIIFQVPSFNQLKSSFCLYTCCEGYKVLWESLFVSVCPDYCVVLSFRYFRVEMFSLNQLGVCLCSIDNLLLLLYHEGGMNKTFWFLFRVI